MRICDRQFTACKTVNRDILLRFESLLADYLHSDKPRQTGLPTVGYFADKICLSPNYFGDLFRRETGVSVKAYIQQQLLGMAKELLLAPSLTVAQVSDRLGFQYPRHFVRFLMRLERQSPSECRSTRM